jgi:multiple sugar transport system substrate-binding protein
MKSRREFLKSSLAGSAVLLAAACGGGAQPTAAPAAQPTAAPAKPTAAPAAQPTAAAQPTTAKPAAPANIQGAEVTLLQWNHFIPTADPFFKQQAEEYSKQSGVKVSVETINGNDLLPRYTAAIQGQSGPTIFQVQNLQALTLADGLSDVSSLAKEFEPNYGKFYGQIDASCKSKDTYVAIPFNAVPNASVYRKSWFQQAGVAKIPETWDEFEDMVKKMAAFGKPVGQAFGQSFGDPPSFCYPMMWSYGGAELTKDYKTAINSKGTLDAVSKTVAMWKGGLDPRGLGGDDSYNNAAFLAEEISCTINGASIYFVGAGLDGKSQAKPWAEDMDHFLNPKGPSGAYEWATTFGHAIPSYVKGKELDAAKDYLKFIYDRKNFDAWFELQKGYSVGAGSAMEQSTMWAELPKALQPFKTSMQISRAKGWEAQPDARVAEAEAKYIVVNMFTRAVQGQAPEEAVKQAETEYKLIFG